MKAQILLSALFFILALVQFLLYLRQRARGQLLMAVGIFLFGVFWALAYVLNVYMRSMSKTAFFALLIVSILIAISGLVIGFKGKNLWVKQSTERK